MLDSVGGGGGGATVSSSVAATVNPTNEGKDGGVSGGSVPGGFGGDAIDRKFAGHQWPREETLALLTMRSDMDAAFRDSSLKAPLWDEVSRKLSELGYQRSPKKCREKFENIYKYDKRTKDCRFGRQTGKNYRYREQLQLLDSHSSLPSPLQHKPHTTGTTMAPQTATTTTPTAIKPSSISRGVHVDATFSVPSPSTESTAPASTSSMSSLEKESESNGKKRRKLDDYFERLVKEVLKRQEDLQNKFIEALERCDKDRTAREQSWRSQESAILKREQEMLAKERALSAARDKAVIAFLEKFSPQGSDLKLPDIQSQVPNSQDSSSIPVTSCSRWPKEEVLALISVRTDFDSLNQDNGSKGPLWEEISTLMKKLGYSRSAKRCKEKWENINKYFKRVKGSNKERSQDSKTCPYFKKLESRYKSKVKKAEDILEQTPESEKDGQNQAEEEDDGDENGEKYRIVASNATPVST